MDSRTLSLAAVWLLAATVVLWVGVGLATDAPSLLAAQRLFTDFPVWQLSMVGSVLAGVAVLLLLTRPAQALVQPAFSLAMGVAMARGPSLVNHLKSVKRSLRSLRLSPKSVKALDD